MDCGKSKVKLTNGAVIVIREIWNSCRVGDIIVSSVIIFRSTGGSPPEPSVYMISMRVLTWLFLLMFVLWTDGLLDTVRVSFANNETDLLCSNCKLVLVNMIAAYA